MRGPAQVTVILFFVAEGYVILKVPLDGAGGTARAVGLGLGVGLGVSRGVAVVAAAIGDEGVGLTIAVEGAEALAVVDEVGAWVPELHDASRRAARAAVADRWPLMKSLRSPRMSVPARMPRSIDARRLAAVMDRDQDRRPRSDGGGGGWS